MTRVLFIGSKSLGLSCLRKVGDLSPASLVGAMTLDDRSDRRSALAGFEEHAKSNGLPLRVARSRSESEAQIAHFRPDLCLVAGWYRRFSPEILRAAAGGFLGIHASLLPRHRGFAPLVWTMIEGDHEAGVTLFSMTDAIDDGDIWGQRSVPIAESDYIADVLVKIEGQALALLDEVWLAILSKSVGPVPQPPVGATYGPQRTPAHGRIDWSLPARRIYDFVRAQSDPYPGAFTTLSGGRKLRIWRARLTSDRPPASPGSCIRLADGTPGIVGGDGIALQLELVSVDDGPPRPAKDIPMADISRISG